MYSPERKINPVAGGRRNTMGRSRAAPCVGPSAGITPMMVPVITPSAPARRLNGWTATPSPYVRSWIACVMGARSADVGKLEDPAGEADLEDALEDPVPGDRNEHAQGDHGGPAVLPDESQIHEQ